MHVNLPRISIIVPSYNQRKFLELTLLSILYQEYPNLELIVIDGGSTDGSVEIIKKYEKFITYWISEKDKGQVDAINKGIKLSTGDWIAFQNSDDMYIGDNFFRLADAVKRFGNNDVLYGDMFIIDENNNYLNFQRMVPFDIKNQMIISHQIHNQSLFFKRSLFDRVGFFDENFRFSFDSEFIFRLAKNGFTSRRIPFMFGAFRQQPDAKSSTMLDVARKENSIIREKYNEALQLSLINSGVTKLSYYVKKTVSMTIEPGWLAYFLTLKILYCKQLDKIKKFAIV